MSYSREKSDDKGSSSIVAGISSQTNNPGTSTSTTTTSTSSSSSSSPSSSPSDTAMNSSTQNQSLWDYFSTFQDFKEFFSEITYTKRKCIYDNTRYAASKQNRTNVKFQEPGDFSNGLTDSEKEYYAKQYQAQRSKQTDIIKTLTQKQNESNNLKNCKKAAFAELNTQLNTVMQSPELCTVFFLQDLKKKIDENSKNPVKLKYLIELTNSDGKSKFQFDAERSTAYQEIMKMMDDYIVKAAIKNMMDEIERINASTTLTVLQKRTSVLTYTCNFLQHLSTQLEADRLKEIASHVLHRINKKIEKQVDDYSKFPYDFFLLSSSKFHDSTISQIKYVLTGVMAGKDIQKLKQKLVFSHHTFSEIRQPNAQETDHFLQQFQFKDVVKNEKIKQKAYSEEFLINLILRVCHKEGTQVDKIQEQNVKLEHIQECILNQLKNAVEDVKTRGKMSEIAIQFISYCGAPKILRLKQKDVQNFLDAYQVQNKNDDSTSLPNYNKIVNLLESLPRYTEIIEKENTTTVNPQDFLSHLILQMGNVQAGKIDDLVKKQKILLKHFEKFMPDLLLLDEEILKKMKQIIQQLSRHPKEDENPETHVLAHALRYMRAKTIAGKFHDELGFYDDSAYLYQGVMKMLDDAIRHVRKLRIEDFDFFSKPMNVCIHFHDALIDGAHTFYVNWDCPENNRFDELYKLILEQTGINKYENTIDIKFDYVDSRGNDFRYDENNFSPSVLDNCIKNRYRIQINLHKKPVVTSNLTNSAMLSLSSTSTSTSTSTTTNSSFPRSIELSLPSRIYISYLMNQSLAASDSAWDNMDEEKLNKSDILLKCRNYQFVREIIIAQLVNIAKKNASTSKITQWKNARDYISTNLLALVTLHTLDLHSVKLIKEEIRKLVSDAEAVKQYGMENGPLHYLCDSSAYKHILKSFDRVIHGFNQSLNTNGFLSNTTYTLDDDSGLSDEEKQQYAYVSDYDDSNNDDVDNNGVISKKDDDGNGKNLNTLNLPKKEELSGEEYDGSASYSETDDNETQNNQSLAPRS